ncbi:hypothetical protein QFC22_002655 [Naganishia vaughanmartiniae]|uniref:Uncharacterized protein n=1 Tax=Naganishia vaughanmartiniae TaxID=1424756 RepID=A0ACC2XBC7_9TREE|nr:hypothetical protein QFC22_002655 [Naganishia vaughanmartiniae]
MNNPAATTEVPRDEKLQAKDARPGPEVNRPITPKPFTDVIEARLRPLIRYWNTLDGFISQDFDETSLTSNIKRSISSPQLWNDVHIHDDSEEIEGTAPRPLETQEVRTVSAGSAAGSECTKHTVPSSLDGVDTLLPLPLENPNTSQDSDETSLTPATFTRSISSPQVHDSYGGVKRTASRSTEATCVRTDSPGPAAGPECTNDIVPSSFDGVEKLPPLSLERSNTLKRKATDKAEVRSKTTQPLLKSRLPSKYEAVLLAAVRFKKVESVQTDSAEPDWTNTAFPFFSGWERLTTYKLRESKNLMQEVAKKAQAQ